MSGILHGDGAIPLCLCQPDVKIKRQRRLNPCLSMCLRYTVFELQNYIVVLFIKSERQKFGLCVSFIQKLFLINL